MTKILAFIILIFGVIILEIGEVFTHSKLAVWAMSKLTTSKE